MIPANPLCNYKQSHLIALFKQYPHVHFLNTASSSFLKHFCVCVADTPPLLVRKPALSMLSMSTSIAVWRYVA